MINEQVISSSDWQYHIRQWSTPNSSTIAFEKFASEKIKKSSNIIDLAAGTGGPTAYLACNYKNIQFTAFDLSNEFLAVGKEMADEKKIQNINFQQGDWLNIEPSTKFDGVISLQALSWFSGFEKPLFEIFNKLHPKRIAFTSLCYEGDMTCHVQVEEYKRDRKSFYNTYSLPAISRFCASNGYKLKMYVPFEIDIDLERGGKDFLGTYTKRVICNNQRGFERLQISGPLLMNWCMVMIEKNSLN